MDWWHENMPSRFLKLKMSFSGLNIKSSMACKHSISIFNKIQKVVADGMKTCHSLGVSFASLCDFLCLHPEPFSKDVRVYVCVFVFL